MKIEPVDPSALVRARAPLRLGLAGGGTDVSPYCDQYGGLVLNATIDRYAYAVLRRIAEPRLRLAATDQELTADLALDDNLLQQGPAGPLALHRAVHRVMSDEFHGGRREALELTTFCDAPVGSGLGASSTLVVAMLRAYDELWNLALDDYAIAQLAFRIERVECGLDGGRQDQYSAAFGGFNYMEFYGAGRTLVNALRIRPWVRSELEASIVLFYTGVSRESARIIADQSSGIAAGRADALAAMHGLKLEAQTMKECLLRGDFDGIVNSLRQGWASKKASSAVVSNPLINAIYDAAAEAGALAGKVSGAGGGGFMLFFVPPERRMQVLRVLQGFDGQTSNCHFTEQGAQAWRV
ncbi:MAG: dehydrogenase [Rubrivivax sp.]|nr:dehydrogenase [Rubrivivax sp.]